jgi:hypothetical protein
MKKQYIKPNIHIENIVVDNKLMDNSLPIYENSESIIEDETEILSNKNSVWSE